MAKINEQPPFTVHVNFEDFILGDRFVYGAYEMQRDEMVAFAERFDPEPFLKSVLVH